MYSCERCGKSSLIGFDSSHKHGGGWSMRAPKSRKIWKPNLQRIKISLNGKTKRYLLCTRCIKLLKKQQNFELKQSSQAAKTLSVN